MREVPVPPIAYPSTGQMLAFRFKATLFQLRRSLVNVLHPVRRYRPTENLNNEAVIAESVTPLWTSHEAIERNLIAGKIQNLRIAARTIDGIEIPANSVFSFWAQVGCPTAAKGYVSGRELRQGCVIPSVGGGLCQLSNALYSAALDAELEIVERHAHTQIIPGSLAEMGRDATVFWNYVDLRFRTSTALRIEASLTQDALVVRFKGQPALLKSHETEKADPSRPIAKSKSCQTCGVTSCSRSIKQPLPVDEFPIAYLLDEYWTEFDQWIQQNIQQKIQPDRKSTDLLAIPIDGKQWRKANYAWNTAGFSQIKQAYSVTLQRSIASRRLATQGASRQQILLKYDRQLANFYAAQLSSKILHCVVMQNLLPFLWQDGHLGGRSFDVLMTRLPLFVLQERLDRAYQNHPESPTLNDFRVDLTLLEAERQALASARFIVTPHSEIAALFPEKSVLLDWQIPQHQTPPNPGNAILFPASTLGRKGAYELRQAAQNLGLTLRILGQELEGQNFWHGVSVERFRSDQDDRSPKDPLAGVGLVVLPAYVEHRPRLLLRAIAAGIPVIVSEACGLGNLEGVITVPTGDAAALQKAIVSF
ncbi:VanW family protein [Leptolyngbya ohadii]|uniref:VanW family protein n=1 Tax=Leptolyngbya ohadii TaxID=1962290 RepID=UPI000B59B10A|nr:VanW family protein [Leptolyngbya ohadii]